MQKCSIESIRYFPFTHRSLIPFNYLSHVGWQPGHQHGPHLRRRPPVRVGPAPSQPDSGPEPSCERRQMTAALRIFTAPKRQTSFMTF